MNATAYAPAQDEIARERIHNLEKTHSADIAALEKSTDKRICTLEARFDRLDAQVDKLKWYILVTAGGTTTASVLLKFLG